MFIVYFFLWTLVLYWLHRLAHKNKFLLNFHADHHKFINKTGNKSKWEFNNIFLYNDSTKSTVDLWLTEVIPTLVFCWLTNQWWIFVFYYLWAAFFQEYLEHNNKIDFLFFSFGTWHLIHHKFPNNNYGLFSPIWDIIFNTNRSINTCHK